MADNENKGTVQNPGEGETEEAKAARERDLSTDKTGTVHDDSVVKSPVKAKGKAAKDGGLEEDPHLAARVLAGQAGAPPAPAVVDEDGQVDPEGPQAVPAPRLGEATRYYAAGEGFQPGNTAPQDLYLDTESGEVVEDQPARGKLLARKGQVLTPAESRVIATHKG
jgi:hypothetical protein